MRLSNLAVAVILLPSFAAFAQHSSSSGGGASSSSSGGGSHSSSSGSHSGGGSHSSSASGSSHSSSSSGGHSASGGHSGSNSHSGGGSSAHSINSHGASSQPPQAGTPRPNAIHANGIHSDATRSTHEFRSPIQSAAPQKRSFFSFLRHPFPRPKPKPEPAPAPEPVRKPVADLRRPVCLRGPCLACPMGHVAGAHGCGFVRHENSCPFSEIWRGGDCVQQLSFLDDCSYLRAAMARQQQSMQAAATERQNACAVGQNQECSEATTRLNNEENLYRQFRDRYVRCQGNLNAFPWSRANDPRTGFGLSFEPRAADWSLMMDEQF